MNIPKLLYRHGYVVWTVIVLLAGGFFPVTWIGVSIMLAWGGFLIWVNRTRLAAWWPWRRKPAAVEEARIEGDTALFAIAQDTPEGDVQVATQRAAFVTQIDRLTASLAAGGLPIHQRLDIELMVRQLRRNVRAIDDAEMRRHATPQNLGAKLMRAYGPVGFSPLGLLLNPLTLGAIAFAVPAAWGAVEHARANHEHSLAQRATEAANHNAEVAQQLEQERDAALARVSEASAQAESSRRNWEAERVRNARSARRERERNHAIENVLVNNEPPAWSLRDTAEPAAGGSDEHPDPAAGGVGGVRH